MIVTLCGSARFEDHFKTWNEALTMAGHTVFTLTRYPSEKGAKLWYTDAQKLALDEAHKRKINASEAVLVLNVFGYMGPSTLSEVEHAKARKKKLYALESWGKGNGIGSNHYDHVQEACRRAVPEYQGSPIDSTTSNGFRYAYDLFDGVSYDERGPLVGMVGLCNERAHGVKAPLTDEKAMRVVINACDSLNITRVHELGGKTRTICDEAGLLEIVRAVEVAHGIVGVKASLSLEQAQEAGCFDTDTAGAKTPDGGQQ